jgi:hypothetical protein
VLAVPLEEVEEMRIEALLPRISPPLRIPDQVQIGQQGLPRFHPEVPRLSLE